MELCFSVAPSHQTPTVEKKKTDDIYPLFKEIRHLRKHQSDKHGENDMH